VTESPRDYLRRLSLQRMLLGPGKWWLRSALLNAAALYICRLLFSGFHVGGPTDYSFAALVIELPAIAWWGCFVLWTRSVVRRGEHAPRWLSWMWAIGGQALIFIAPVLLATYLPGLLLAEWLTSLRINGFWAYLGACAITAAILIALRGANPLFSARDFIRTPQPVADPAPQGS
jgi:hypothetical protein